MAVARRPLHTYVAFLRAVNVGGRTVKMAELRSAAEDAGLANARTFIASGNLIFDSPISDTQALERAVAAACLARLGFEVPSFVRSAAAVHDVAAREPFSPADATAAPTCIVGFLERPPSTATRKAVEALTNDIHQFVVIGAELHWLSTLPQSDPKFRDPRLDKALGMSVTFRGVNTVRRLSALLATSPRPSTS